MPKFTREVLELASKEQLIDIILLLQEQNEMLAKQVERIPILEARIVELERRLGLNSGNSSKPPSSDAPGNKPKSKSK